jgi:hypothetical protein
MMPTLAHETFTVIEPPTRPASPTVAQFFLSGSDILFAAFHVAANREELPVGCKRQHKDGIALIISPA